MDLKQLQHKYEMLPKIVLEEVWKEAQKNLLEEIEKVITDDMIGNSPCAFSLFDKLAEFHVELITKEVVKTPEFKKRFESMLH